MIDDKRKKKKNTQSNISSVSSGCAGPSNRLASDDTIENIANGHILVDLSFGVESNEDVNEVVVEMATAFSYREDEVESVAPNEKERNKFRWSIESSWTSLEEALVFLEEEGFVNYDDSDLKCGQKFYFRCKRIPKSRKS